MKLAVFSLVFALVSTLAHAQATPKQMDSLRELANSGVIASLDCSKDKLPGVTFEVLIYAGQAMSDKLHLLGYLNVSDLEGRPKAAQVVRDAGIAAMSLRLNLFNKYAQQRLDNGIESKCQFFPKILSSTNIAESFKQEAALNIASVAVQAPASK